MLDPAHNFGLNSPQFRTMSERASWLSYEFKVYSPATTQWTDVAGVYIFAGLKSKKEWEAYYIGQTESFQESLTTHDQWEPAAKLGATHVHAITVTSKAVREKMERELILACQPPLNPPSKPPA